MIRFDLIENSISDSKFLKLICKLLLQDNNSSIYHHPERLNAIQETLNQKGFYLVSLNNSGEPDGLLPFIEFKDMSFQKK